jgi:methionyl-tRNA formyltransferase
MGISPQYRGSSCNFWALYDHRPDLVGATLHLLSAGLDSGNIIRHALPPTGIQDGFLLGMASVKSAHEALLELIRSGRDYHRNTEAQDRTRQIRYTRNADFTDAVAAEYLARLPSAAEIQKAIEGRNTGDFRHVFAPSTHSRW